MYIDSDVRATELMNDNVLEGFSPHDSCSMKLAHERGGVETTWNAGVFVVHR